MSEDQWSEGEDNEARLAELDRTIAANDLSARADALVEKAQILHSEGESEYPAVIAHLEAAIDINSQLERSREQVFPHWLLGDVYVAKKNDEAAREAYLAAVRHARDASAAHDALPMCFSNLASISRRQQNDLEAIEYLTVAIEEAKQLTPGSMQLFGLYMQIVRSYDALNMFAEADECLDEAYEIAVKFNHVRPMVDAYLEKAWLRLKNNQLDELPQIFEKLEACLDLAVHPFAQEFMDVLLLAYQTRTNPTLDTIKGLEALRDIGRDRADAAMLGLVNIERARFHLAVGNFEEARKVLRKLEVTAPENFSRRYSLHEVHLLTAEAYEREGDWLSAIDYVKKALETSTRVPVLGETDQLRLRLGELHIQAGSYSLALAELEALPLDTWQSEEEGWIRQVFALARAYEASERHTESLVMANQLLCKIEPDGSKVLPEFDFPENLDAYWISAQLHELKCQALQALGEIEPAAREAEKAKSVYETTEDFESMARTTRAIKSTDQSPTTHEQKVVKQQEELGELPGGYWH